MTVLPYVIIYGSATAIVVYQVRVLYRGRGRTVWWQRVRPLGWISVALFYSLAYATVLWPILPPAVTLLPGAALVALNVARLIGQHRSERDEVRRDRQLGQPTHRYLSSTSTILLTVGLATALLVLVTASETTGAVSNVLLYLSLALAGASTVHYLYRRARRHHENILIALHRAAERADTRRPATTGSVRPPDSEPDHR